MFFHTLYLFAGKRVIQTRLPRVAIVQYVEPEFIFQLFFHYKRLGNADKKNLVFILILYSNSTYTIKTNHVH